ncbi:hypothetical protein EII25_02260 [Erysipelotrichaceae bacterium OH741_COT-311]|nr:hypothetical protein EII25_02260 [Erysipelotrichaceae bacterium OH741_COT-311]
MNIQKKIAVFIFVFVFYVSTSIGRFVVKANFHFRVEEGLELIAKTGRIAEVVIIGLGEPAKLASIFPVDAQPTVPVNPPSTTPTDPPPTIPNDPPSTTPTDPPPTVPADPQPTVPVNPPAPIVDEVDTSEENVMEDVVVESTTIVDMYKTPSLNVPKTMDSTNMMSLFTITVVSIIGLISILYTKKTIKE